MSVRRAQQEIDAAEFGEWIAYLRLEPLPGERADMWAAYIAYLLTGALRGEGQRAPQLADFLPEAGTRAPQRQSAMEIEAKMNMFARLHNKGAEKT